MAGLVDADTHVIESAPIWELIDKKMYPRRPVLVSIPGDTLYGKRNAFWLIDGEIFPRPAGKGGFFLATPSVGAGEASRDDIALGCREMTDPTSRVRDMDIAGIETQVIYPTLFIIYLTSDPELEAALCGAYNTFMAQACAVAPSRLRWVAVLPLRSIAASIKELHLAKGRGAAGVLMRGVEGDRSVADPYFFPLYREASDLGLPICIHLGAGSPAFRNILNVDISHTFPYTRLSVLIAFRDIIHNKLPERFPQLRFGFIETGAFWIPFVLHDLWRSTKDKRFLHGPELFKEYRLYTTCYLDEDLPFLLNYVGEDNLVVGSDYGHQDLADERALVANLRGRRDLPSSVVEKMLYDNPRRFYGMSG
jgi:predicted TIM-barrel fold metal-dependent hydrolase